MARQTDRQTEAATVRQVCELEWLDDDDDDDNDFDLQTTAWF